VTAVKEGLEMRYQIGQFLGTERFRQERMGAQGVGFIDVFDFLMMSQDDNEQVL